jgi:hypothetical protein
MSGEIPGSRPEELTSPQEQDEGVRENGEQITVEGARSNLAELKSRLAEQRTKRAREIEEKLVERRGLHEAARETTLPLQDARRLLAEYQALHSEGLLQTDADRKAFQDVSELVRSLEEQRKASRRRAAGIAHEPGVRESLVEERSKRREGIKLEQKKQELATKYDAVQEKLKLSAEDVAREVDDLAANLHNIEGKIESQKTQRHKVWKKIEAKFDERLDPSIKRKTYRQLRQLGDIIVGWNSTQELRTKLEQLRDSLGRFTGHKARKFINGILSQGELFDSYDSEAAKLGELEDEKARIEQEINSLGKKYKQLIANAWEKGDELAQEGDADSMLDSSRRLYNLASDTDAHFGNIVERKYAEIQYEEPGEKEGTQILRGKYKDWAEAVYREPRMQTLNRVFRSVRSAASQIVHVHPRIYQEHQG